MTENQLLIESLKKIVMLKASPEFCLFNQFDFEWLCYTKAELSGWIQAIGSAVAIYVAVRIANNQHVIQNRERELSDAQKNLQYAAICNELCLAVESIAKFGLKEWELAATKLVQADKHKFFFHLDKATSTHRLENLQSSIISLLQKEMPSELMVTLFSLQKNLAIYASTISMHHNDDDRFQFLDFYKAQDELKEEIDKLKEGITIYKKKVQEEVGHMA